MLFFTVVKPDDFPLLAIRWIRRRRAKRLSRGKHRVPGGLDFPDDMATTNHERVGKGGVARDDEHATSPGDIELLVEYGPCLNPDRRMGRLRAPASRPERPAGRQLRDPVHLAAVIHSLWEKGDRSPLILPANLSIDDSWVQFELTRYLPDNWVPVIEKDVDGQSDLPHRLDGEIANLGSSRPAGASRAPSISGRRRRQEQRSAGSRIGVSSSAASCWAKRPPSSETPCGGWPPRPPTSTRAAGR